jgi:hypothetical protein
VRLRKDVSDVHRSIPVPGRPPADPHRAAPEARAGGRSMAVSATADNLDRVETDRTVRRPRGAGDVRLDSTNVAVLGAGRQAWSRSVATHM